MRNLKLYDFNLYLYLFIMGYCIFNYFLYINFNDNFFD